MDLSEKIAAFDLPGSACEFGEQRGRWQRWRQRVRDQARASFASLNLPLADPVRLVCHFRVLRRAKAHDLDNILKQLIDGLGAAGLFRKARTGGRTSEWNTEDDWVYVIEATKELVDSEASTYVEIYVSKEVARVVRTI